MEINHPCASPFVLVTQAVYDVISFSISSVSCGATSLSLFTLFCIYKILPSSCNRAIAICAHRLEAAKSLEDK